MCKVLNHFPAGFGALPTGLGAGAQVLVLGELLAGRGALVAALRTALASRGGEGGGATPHLRELLLLPARPSLLQPPQPSVAAIRHGHNIILAAHQAMAKEIAFPRFIGQKQYM